jgi:uncharacterized membrane protein (DUF485 family)
MGKCGRNATSSVMKLTFSCPFLRRSYYSKSSVGWGYQIPIAYFLAGLIVYIYSFFATLRK